MSDLIKFFINNAKFTLVLTIALIVFGLQGLSKTRNEQNPTVDTGKMIVSTTYYGATSKEIESDITKKIEDELQSVSGIKDIVSISQANFSNITIRVDFDNYDMDEVKDDINKAIDRVSDLPKNIQDDPEVTEIKTDEFSVLKIAITGTNKNRKRDNFVEFLEDELEDVKGVSETSNNGFREREFSIFLDRSKMKEHYISIAEITKALAERQIDVPAGQLDGFDKQGFVKIESKAKNVKELSNSVVRANFNGNKVRLKDVARVVDHMEKEEVRIKYNGKEATIVEVKKQSRADTVRLVERVKERIEQIKKTEIAEGIDINYFYDESLEVGNRFNTIKSNVFSSAIIVLIFLFIFLPGKIGAMSTLSLPLSILIIIGFFPVFEIQFNVISILALVISMGMLVDNSVVVSETFASLREDGMMPKEAAFHAVKEHWISIFCISMTTVLAFVPMFLTKGVMGLFIYSIPTVVILSLAVSVAEACFLLPIRLIYVGTKRPKVKKNKKKKEGDWFSPVIKWFEGFVYKCITFRYLVLALFVLMLYTIGYYMKINKFILFPSESVKEYSINYELENGSSIEKLDQASERLRKSIIEVLGEDVVEYIVAINGLSGGDGFNESKQNHHTAMMTVYITTKASKAMDYKEVLSKLRSIDTSYMKSINFNEIASNGPGVGKAVEVTFRSNIDKNLKEFTYKMKDELAKIDGILDIETDDYLNDDDIVVEIDYDKIARIGISSQTIGNALRAGIDGYIVAEVTLNNKTFDIKAKLDGKYTDTVNDIKNIEVMDKNGNLIKIGKFATVKRRQGSRVIHRYNFKRSIKLSANVDENIITSMKANAEVQKLYDKYGKDYSDISIAFTGQQESTNESFDSLMDGMVLAIIGIFGILVFMFSSLSKPLIILTSLPLSWLGFTVAFYYHDRPISFLALIGMIGLMGIAVNTGIILIDLVEKMRKKNRNNMSVKEILAKASSMRLRAIVTTSLTTIAGLMPTAYGIGGEDATLIPMTLAMAWGLVSDTFLTIIWVPCAYGVIEDFVVMIRKFRVFRWFMFRKVKNFKVKPLRY